MCRFLCILSVLFFGQVHGQDALTFASNCPGKVTFEVLPFSAETPEQPSGSKLIELSLFKEESDGMIEQPTEFRPTKTPFVWLRVSRTDTSLNVMQLYDGPMNTGSTLSVYANGALGIELKGAWRYEDKPLPDWIYKTVTITPFDFNGYIQAIIDGREDVPSCLHEVWNSSPTVSSPYTQLFGSNSKRNYALLERYQADHPRLKLTQTETEIKLAEKRLTEAGFEIFCITD